MIKFECDKPEIETALKKLGNQIRAAGGSLNDQASVHVQGGAITVYSSFPPEKGATLFFLPASCLLPIKKIRTALQGDDMVIESHDDNVPKAKLEMMETMLEIYNLTGKIPFHRTTSPWLAFGDDPKALKWIVNGRPDSPYAKELKTKGKFEDQEKMIVDSFLHTRYLNFRGPNPVLMPFVDFANHHAHALGFSSIPKDKNGPGIALMNSKPVPDTDEVFVQYQLFDAMDMYTIYGYVEKTTPFVRSIPVVIKLDGVGTIAVQAFQGAHKKAKLPPKVADLRPYLPKVLERKGDALKISHLNIPNPVAPNALRRVLGGYINAMKPGLAPAQLKGYTKEAEFHVITRNIKFYQNMMSFMDLEGQKNPKNPAYKMASDLATVQLEKLAQYKMLA